MADLFDEYRRMKPAFDEKELGYAFVCYANKRDKVEQFLARLDSQPEKGTSFMYDCLLQTLLSNFEALEDLSEKILDVSILKNRVVLTNPQIMKSLVVFKKSSRYLYLDLALTHSPNFWTIVCVSRKTSTNPTKLNAKCFTFSTTTLKMFLLVVFSIFLISSLMSRSQIIQETSKGKSLVQSH